jgi:hypothetical protein
LLIVWQSCRNAGNRHLGMVAKKEKRYGHEYAYYLVRDRNSNEHKVLIAIPITGLQVLILYK